MKNWQKMIIGTIVAGIGTAITMWPEKKHAEEQVEEVTDAEIVEVPAEEIKEVSEEVTEG